MTAEELFVKLEDLNPLAFQDQRNQALALIREALPGAAQWTRSTPARPGHYFFRRYPNDQPTILTVGLSLDTVSWPGGLAVDYLYNLAGEWYGPLEAPR